MRTYADEKVGRVLLAHRRRDALRHRRDVLGADVRVLAPADPDADDRRGGVPLHAIRGARAEADVDLVVEHHEPHRRPVLAFVGSDGQELERVELRKAAGSHFGTTTCGLQPLPAPTKTSNAISANPPDSRRTFMGHLRDAASALRVGRGLKHGVSPRVNRRARQAAGRES